MPQQIFTTMRASNNVKSESIFADWRNSRAIYSVCSGEKAKLTFLLQYRSPLSVIKSSRKEGTAANEQIEGIFISSANYEGKNSIN